MLAPQPGNRPAPPALEGKVWTTGPPGESFSFIPGGGSRALSWQWLFLSTLMIQCRCLLASIEDGERLDVTPAVDLHWSGFIWRLFFLWRFCHCPFLFDIAQFCHHMSRCEFRLIYLPWDSPDFLDLRFGICRYNSSTKLPAVMFSLPVPASYHLLPELWIDVP